MKSIGACIVCVFVAANTRAGANEIRINLNKADVVVVATLHKASDAGMSWLDFGSQHTLYPTKRLVLDVQRYIKGGGLSRIEVPVPTHNTCLSTDPRHAAVAFDLSVGRAALWFLQKGKAGGVFSAEARTPNYADGVWTAPGFTFAPLSVMASFSEYIPLSTTKCVPGQTALVTLADLFTRNAASAGDGRWRYLDLLKLVTWDEWYASGYDVPVAGEDKDEEKRWFRDVYPTLMKPKDDVEKLNDLAVRLYWGERERENQFVQLYYLLPKGSLKVSFPVLRIAENMLRLAETSEPSAARSWFVALRQAPKTYKKQLLALAVKRFGQDHGLDAGILECIAAQYDRPDFLPWDKNARIPADLSDKIAAVKELAKTELGSP